jgi:hypothetical protein
MYHITYKKTNFRVLAPKIVVKLNITGTTVTPELIGTLRIGDSHDYIIKYGTSDIFPTVSGKYRVTVKIVITRGSEIVTSNYNVVYHSATLQV